MTGSDPFGTAAFGALADSVSPAERVVGCLYPDTPLYPDTLLVPDAAGCQFFDGPGGGGYGAEMSREFFERYEPLYRPRLRKQKQKRS